MMVPQSRPRLTQIEAERIVKRHGIDREKYPLLILGIRGYYLDTMGKPGANDRGIWDDALAILTPHVFAAFNGNTDPSRYRKGKGRGVGKGMASLKPGFWPCYRFDMHRPKSGPYPAICQRAGQVIVIRDGDPPYEDKGNFGINIHRGGRNTTGSEGCQTVYPFQWDAFYALAKAEAKSLWGRDWNKRIVGYLLIDESEVTR